MVFLVDSFMPYIYIPGTQGRGTETQILQKETDIYIFQFLQFSNYYIKRAFNKFIPWCHNLGRTRISSLQTSQGREDDGCDNGLDSRTLWSKQNLIGTVWLI